MGKTRNTGFSNNAIQYNSGSIAFTSGSTTRMFISASGNVGIGTTNPTSKLSVSGSIESLIESTYEGGQLILRGNTYRYNLDNYSGSLRFFRENDSDGSAGIVHMFVSSSGNVGMGTVTPVSKLEINDTNNIPLRFGDIAAAPSSQTAGYIGMSTSAYNGTNGDLVLYPRTSATSKILLMGGNVGIGTTSPGSLLSLEKAKAGSGVESLDMLTLRITGTTAIGDALNIKFLNGVNTNIATISALLGADNVAYGTLTFSIRNYTTDSVVESMRISNRGNLLIGTTSEATESNLILGAKGVDEGGQLTMQRGTNWTYATHLDNFQNQFRLLYGTNTGTTGVNFTVFHLSGNYSFSGSNVSDRRLKNNINSLSFNALEKISQLTTKSFNMKDNPDVLRYGFIAQEVQEVIPDIITGTESEDDVLGLDYNGVLTVAVKAIQELKADNDALKTRIETLENK